MSLLTVVLGDWNATPADRGRYTPTWIAKRSGLVLAATGPGKHGDIDYALTDARVRDKARHPAPGGDSRSDHDVIVYVLGKAPNQLRVATWNVLYGRDPRVVRKQVALVLTQWNLDVLCLQEAADYHTELSKVPGYRMVAFPEPGRWHQVVMVRDGVPVRRPKPVRLSPHGWRLVAGGSHSELWGTHLIVDSWLRVLDIHMPPSVNWRRGVIWGPPMRVAAYAAAAGKIPRWTRRHRRLHTP